MIEANAPAGIGGAQRGMAARPDSTEALSGMRFPALIIVGEEDTLTPVGEAERLREHIPGASLQVIEKAGHLSNLEQPLKFNTALTEFVDSIETPQSGRD